MSFLNIHILWHLLWVLPLLGIIIATACLRREKILKTVLGSRWRDPEFILLSRPLRTLRLVVFIAATLLLFAAAARPYWGQRLLPFSSQGRDIMVLFDVSKSMLSQDVQPSRMAHAKWFVRQLVNESHGDRFGLIAFAGQAFLECPLTSDKSTFNQYLNDLDTATIPVGGTNIQLAIDNAIEAFKAAEGQHRAILLVTDGDELTGDSKKAVEELKKLDIPLLVVGVGDPLKPGLIPVPGENGKGTVFMRDKNGEYVKSSLNEKQLAELASLTGGCYARSTAASININKVQQRIKQLIPKEFEHGKQTRPIERFHYPLIGGLALLLLWLLISERTVARINNRLKTGLNTIIVLLLLGGTGLNAQNVVPADEKPLPLAPAAELQAETPVAEQAPAGKGVKKMTAPADVYNQALALQAKNPQQAAEMYRQAINMNGSGKKIQASSYQNLGVMQHEQARKAMEQSLATVKQQNLDGALQLLDSADAELNKAEELYVEAIAAAAAVKTPQSQVNAPSDIAQNQQKLLFDRQIVEKMRKKIEELKKKQQEAQKKTQEAQQKQQQANNDQQKQDQQQNKQDQQKQDQQQNKQDQQKQDQQQNKQDQQQNKQDQQQNMQDQQKQDQQQNKQDRQQNKQDQQKQDQQQNKQDQQDKQQQADQARQDAQQAVKDLKDMAGKMDQKNLEKQADEAQKELDKAQQEQQKDNGGKAEEHLRKAAEKLQSQQNKDNQQDKQQQNKQDQQKQDKKDKNKQDQQDKQDQNKGQQDKPLPQQQPKKAKDAKAERGKEKDIDKNQADAVLQSMANEEKSLRDAIKERMKEAYRNQDVEKDW